MIKLKTYFIAIFLFTNIFLFGQTHPENKELSKWTFGTILVSENNWRPRLQSNFMPNFFPGVIVKYNLKKFSLRLGIEHTQTIYDPKEFNSYYFIDGYKRETLGRLGIEKGFIIKRFVKPIVALDIFVSKSYSDTYSGGGYSGFYFRSYVNSSNFGLKPTIGVEFILSKSFSISLESNFNFQWSKSEIEQANITLDEGFETRVNHYFYKNFNSIGAFSLNYHF
jgi:hypothetical protein